MKAACLPGRQGGKGLPEPFHHQGAGGLLFPFRFFLHQNILRGNGLLRKMVFHAGGCVQRVTVIVLFGVIRILCAACLHNGVCHLVRHFHKGVFLTNRVVVFLRLMVFIGRLSISGAQSTGAAAGAPHGWTSPPGMG